MGLSNLFESMEVIDFFGLLYFIKRSCGDVNEYMDVLCCK